jgi:hypothetical protein
VQAQRRSARFFGLHVRDHAVRFHLTQNEVAPAQRPLRVQNRREGDRSLRQPGQQRCFGQSQVLGVLGKIKLRSSLEPIHPAAQVNLVPVKRKDLFLREGALDLDGQVRLLNLAPGGALIGKEEIARQLHGERGSALRAAVAADVVPRGAGHAEDIDAPVRLEVLVFDGDHRLAQNGRKSVIAHDNAPLQGKGAEESSVAVIEVRCGGRAVVLKIIDLRQVSGIDQREPGQ